MLKTLAHLIRAGHATQAAMFPDLPAHARGLPKLTDAPCEPCGACVEACPTRAIAVAPAEGGGRVLLDRGRCIACGECVAACSTGTIVADRSTRVAERTREALVLGNPAPAPSPRAPEPPPVYHRSLHFREVSTGDAASDLEVIASGNPIFDSSRFGIHGVASPRFADALVVTGPVGLAMQEPLRRCWDAMAEPAS